MQIARHAKILEIISYKDIETQEQLTEELKINNMIVTQATVSRDIKRLNLIKSLSTGGRYKYSAMPYKNDFLISKLITIFKNTVLNVETVSNFITVKTISGAGAAAAEAIDCLDFQGIAGTNAGDNTVFVITRTNERAGEIAQKMKNMLNR